MNGLILKDFLNLKKSILPMLFFLIMYFFISLYTKNSNFFTGIIMVFCAMLPITALSYDDKSGFTKYALTMPVSRDLLVISKYIMFLILIVFGSLFSFLNNIFIGDLPLEENIFSVAATMLIGSIMLSISLPAIFKFGVEKGRLIMFAVLIPIGFLGGFAGMAITNGNISISTEPSIDFFLSNTSIFLLILAVCTVIFLLSMWLSISIYRKKDF